MRRSLTKQTFGGFLWLFTGAGAQVVLQFLILIVLARLLSPSEFGLIGAALVIISFCQVLSQIGIGPAIVQRPNLTAVHIHVGFTISCVSGLLVASAVALSAPWIAAFFGMPELKAIVPILSLILLVSAPSVVLNAILQRELRFKALAMIQLISFGFGYGVVGIVAAIAGMGVWALVFAYLGQASLKFLLLLSIRVAPLGFAVRRKEFKELLNFGIGFSIARIANSVAIHGDNLIVGRWLGADALGIYSRSYQLVLMPVNLLGAVFDKVLFPAMASIQGENSRLSHAFLRAIGVVAMTSIPLSIVFIIIAPELVYILLGDQWNAVVFPFQVLAAVMVFRTGYKMSAALIRAKGAVYRHAWRQCIYAGGVLLGALIGQNWGVDGVAVGVAAATVLIYFLMINLGLKLCAVTWHDVLLIHLRHIGIGVVIGVISITGKMIALNWELRPVFVVAFVLMVSAGGVGTLWGIRKEVFGEEGIWLANILFDHWNGLVRRFGIRRI